MTTQTKILFDTEDFDVNGEFANSTFTATVAGYYFVTANVYYLDADYSTNATAILYIRKNTSFRETSFFEAYETMLSRKVSLQVSGLVQMNIGDTIEIWGTNGAAGGALIIGHATGIGASSVNIHRV